MSGGHKVDTCTDDTKSASEERRRDTVGTSSNDAVGSTPALFPLDLTPSGSRWSRVDLGPSDLRPGQGWDGRRNRERRGRREKKGAGQMEVRS